MLVLLSPSKNLDFTSKVATRKRSEPIFLNRAEELIGELRQLGPAEVSELMGISVELGALNAERYENWRPNTKGGRPAALAFRGDVYLGFDAPNFSERDLTSAQRRVRILSGLYGVLRPLDLIHPYRLEMGTVLGSGGIKDLHGYWSQTITEQLNADLSAERNPLLVNCASVEYFPEASQKRIGYPVVTCRFLQKHGDDYRFMSYFGKRARGLMARHLVLTRANTRTHIKTFDAEGYYFSPERSSKDNLVFLRDERPHPAST